jgi:hypothetical protein
MRMRSNPVLVSEQFEAFVTSTLDEFDMLDLKMFQNELHIELRYADMDEMALIPANSLSGKEEIYVWLMCLN